MTSTWNDLVSPAGAVGDQFTADTYNKIVGDLDWLKNPPSDLYAPSVADSNITSSSTTFVDLTGFTITFTSQGGKILVFFTCRASSTNARFDMLLDGVSITGDNDGMGAVTPASTFGNNMFMRIIAASAGSHTIKIQHRVTTGSDIIYPAGLCQLAAWEIGNIA